MEKYYLLTDTEKRYWQFWQDEHMFMVQSGELGTTGDTRVFVQGGPKAALQAVIAERDEMIEHGYVSMYDILPHILVVEYSIDGDGSAAELQKRQAAEEWLHHELEVTGLGHGDGGSIGDGTMEIVGLVVDYATAKKVVEEGIEYTDFSDYTQIYQAQFPD